MTLEVLAGLTGISKSFLSRVENGHRALDRRSHLHAIADALEVSLTDLTGQPYVPTKDRTISEATATIPELRIAVMDGTLADPLDLPTRPLAALVHDLRDLGSAHARADYADLGRLLPPAISELQVIAESSRARDERDQALRLLVQCGFAAYDTCRTAGYLDLAWIAAERAREAAEMLDNDAWIGVAQFIRALCLLTAKASNRALRTAVATAEQLQPRIGADHSVAQLYGMMHLSAALASAALRQPRSGDANAHLDEAAEVARRTGECPWEPLHTAFGPTNVEIWRLAINLELGDYDSAIAAAERIAPEQIAQIVRLRQVGYYTQYGRALAQTRHRNHDAIRSLRTAERLAPAHVRADPTVREAVSVMLNQAQGRAVGRDLRGIAYRIGLAH